MSKGPGKKRGIRAKTRPSFALRTSLFALLIALGATSCALYRNDTCYVSDQQYSTARDMFVATGSLDVVKRQLEAYEWKTCKINEITYRLTKEFEVLPEELPTTNTTTRRGQ